jgi:chemotaxis protein CheD
LAKRVVVGIAEMAASAEPNDLLITYALGSCLGVAIYDPVARVGGLLHAMLPSSEIDPQKARDNPCMFVDTGVPRLFLECYKAGAKKERIILKVAGGANLNGNGPDHFEIGKRNVLALRKLLWKNGVLIQSSDLGASLSRTMSLEIASGQVRLKIRGTDKFL